MLIDTHAHYDDSRFDNDRDELLQSLKSKGIAYVVNASSNVSSNAMSISLSRKFDFIFASVGIHPHDSSDFNDEVLDMLRSLSSNEKVVAIGEIGLDYYYDNVPREIQKSCFAKQIRLARQLDLPIIIHDRDAHEDTLKIIRDEHASEVGGVMHAYSGSVEMARELLKLNFYFGIGGVCTFKNAKKVVEVIKYLPMERIVLETDCPYLTPEPFRGRRNDSGYLVYIAEKIAQIKNMDVEEVAHITSQNAIRLFNLPV